MSIKRIFKNTMIGSQFLLKNGKAIQFPDGRYITDSEVEIAELDAEIAAGVPHLYVDRNEYQIDTTLQDMIAEAQREAALKVMKEYGSRVGEKGEVISQPLKQTPEGGDFKPGASDAQQASQATKTNLTADSDTKADEVKPFAPNQNLAHLLANKTASTGVAGSNDVKDAAAGSAS
jgi:hypothetical protein